MNTFKFICREAYSNAYNVPFSIYKLRIYDINGNYLEHRNMIGSRDRQSATGLLVNSKTKEEFDISLKSNCQLQPNRNDCTMANIFHPTYPPYSAYQVTIKNTFGATNPPVDYNDDLGFILSTKAHIKRMTFTTGFGSGIKRLEVLLNDKSLGIYNFSETVNKTLNLNNYKENKKYYMWSFYE